MKKGMILLAMAVMVSGCSDSTGPDAVPEVTLSFSAVPEATAPFSRSGGYLATQSDSLIVTSSSDVLVLNRVEVVLQEVELRHVGVVDCTGDDCAQFESGPFLLDLSLAAGSEQVFAIEIDEGQYDIIEFDIHKVTSGGNTAEEAFLSSHPDLEDISIRIHGSFNGTPFVYTSDLNEEQEVNLSQPLAVSGSGGTNLTVLLDVAVWFFDSSGELIDPATANKGERNEDLVEANIRTAFEVFHDEDFDGRDDNSEGGS